jgi:hypothetical protein
VWPDVTVGAPAAIYGISLLVLGIGEGLFAAFRRRGDP